MSDTLQYPTPSDPRPRSPVIAATVIAALMPAAILFAQQTPAHLNPVVEKLAQGKLYFGISISEGGII
jgi:hypothetical protein